MTHRSETCWYVCVDDMLEAITPALACVGVRSGTALNERTNEIFVVLTCHRYFTTQLLSPLLHPYL